MCPFHQTKSTPASDATKAREAERERPVQRDVVAERAHPHRVVADPLEREPERRADDVAQQRVARRARHDEGDVVEPVRVLVDVADQARQRRMPLIPPKPENVVTWPKNSWRSPPNVSVIIRK